MSAEVVGRYNEISPRIINLEGFDQYAFRKFARDAIESAYCNSGDAKDFYYQALDRLSAGPLDFIDCFPTLDSVMRSVDASYMTLQSSHLKPYKDKYVIQDERIIKAGVGSDFFRNVESFISQKLHGKLDFEVASVPVENDDSLLVSSRFAANFNEKNGVLRKFAQIKGVRYLADMNLDLDIPNKILDYMDKNELLPNDTQLSAGLFVNHYLTDIQNAYFIGGVKYSLVPFFQSDAPSSEVFVNKLYSFTHEGQHAKQNREVFGVIRELDAHATTADTFFTARNKWRKETLKEYGFADCTEVFTRFNNYANHAEYEIEKVFQYIKSPYPYFAMIADHNVIIAQRRNALLNRGW